MEALSCQGNLFPNFYSKQVYLYERIVSPYCHDLYSWINRLDIDSALVQECRVSNAVSSF